MLNVFCFEVAYQMIQIGTNRWEALAKPQDFCSVHVLNNM